MTKTDSSMGSFAIDSVKFIIDIVDGLFKWRVWHGMFCAPVTGNRVYYINICPTMENARGCTLPPPPPPVRFFFFLIFLFIFGLIAVRHVPSPCSPTSLAVDLKEKKNTDNNNDEKPPARWCGVRFFNAPDEQFLLFLFYYYLTLKLLVSVWEKFPTLHSGAAVNKKISLSVNTDEYTRLNQIIWRANVKKTYISKLYCIYFPRPLSNYISLRIVTLQSKLLSLVKFIIS